MLKKKEEGMFTVEAAILMPFLIILTFSAVLFVIFFYDRVLMVQDVNAVIADIRAGSNESSVMNHPYILLKDMDMTISQKGSKLTVKISGTWNNPVFGKLIREISCEKTETGLNPAGIMRITRDIKEKAEAINVSNQNNP